MCPTRRLPKQVWQCTLVRARCLLKAFLGSQRCPPCSAISTSCNSAYSMTTSAARSASMRWDPGKWMGTVAEAAKHHLLAARAGAVRRGCTPPM
eukprot:1252816-Amphidinium_carterae.1